MRFAGIDQGTTSTRILTVDAVGNVNVAHSVQHAQTYPRPGWVEQDPEELLRNICACLAAAGPLDAVGIDNQGESCLAWDSETGEAFMPVISWQDSRTEADIARLKMEGAEELTLARAGLPLDTYFPAAKLGWVLRNSSSARSAFSRGTLRLGTTDAFFHDRLGRRFVTDVSTASRTSLMSLDSLAWDPDLCALFGVPIEALPDIVPTTGDFGAFDLASGSVPVVASIVDQQAALYGLGCHQPGQAKMTFGTGAFALMVTGGEILRNPTSGLFPTVAWRKAGEAPVFAVEGGVYSASSAINWARSLGLFADLSEISSFEGPHAIESGLAFVPALVGLGCPYRSSRARGVWVGLSQEHGARQLVRSILEGVAFRSQQVIGAFARQLDPEGPIVIDGGMSRNPYFVQFLCNLLGREVHPAHNPEMTALGTARLVHDHIGAGIFPKPRFATYRPEQDLRHMTARFSKAVELSLGWAEAN
ncbi:FGGY family carbohydrate kinase [Tabrizicola sp.]|uniref:FGGY family carbohydrate kinase n=1 Tax=Tabrizicola sp. TaxID=2005166 RepID=UPI0026294526|nr:FGGY family carbohydrate kinase [Tabrizicola sp.]MDM7933662.1 FGGY family carbohydrate kinase [Tabrizicola sp.]